MALKHFLALKQWSYGLAIAAVLVFPALAQQPQDPQPAIIPGMPRPQPQFPPLVQAPAAPATPQAAGQPPAGPPPAQPPPGPPTVYGGLSLNNASLTEVIDLLARQLKINYILDPRVRGGVILNTYGETKDIDTRSLLETILRINGYGMAKQGDLYRIVPLPDISHLPIPPESKTDPNTIPDDDQTMLNLVFLKYVTAEELVKVLEPFEGENARIYVYAPANLLLMLDSRRNMRRLMELVAMFDSDTLTNQRVRVFSVKNGRPSDLAKELENISKAIALSDKNSPIRFLPIDRINTIIAVAPNPGAFAQVQTWLDKLDVPIKAAAGGIKDYVYRVHYGDATTMACSIQALYGQLSGYGSYYGGPQTSIQACIGSGVGGVGAPGVGTNGLGGGIFGGAGVIGAGGAYGNNGYGAYGAGAYGAGAYGAGAYGANPYGAGAYGAGAYGAYGASAAPVAQTPFVNPALGPAAPGATTPAGAAASGDLTGQYLGVAPPGFGFRGPRVIANPLNNTLLIQATAQEYESIEDLIKELDVPPRQVLIEAKIYSIDLSHGFSSSITGALAALSGSSATSAGSTTTSTTPTSTAASLLGSLVNNSGIVTTSLSAAMLVGKSRVLSGIVQLMESESDAKIISSPSIIATDSIPASISVGTTVPTLSSSTASGITGSVTTGISNTSSGIGLSIVARVTPSGIVTMIINQNVSDPTPTTTSTISSPSFATKSVQTQVTVQDGDTIAIGGQIQESTTSAVSGIPVLDRIPYIGGLFGAKSYSKERTELIIFLTPHVIYDSNQLLDATDELRNQIKLLRKDVKE